MTDIPVTSQSNQLIPSRSYRKYSIIDARHWRLERARRRFRPIGRFPVSPGNGTTKWVFCQLPNLAYLHVSMSAVFPPKRNESWPNASCTANRARFQHHSQSVWIGSTLCYSIDRAGHTPLVSPICTYLIRLSLDVIVQQYDATLKGPANNTQTYLVNHARPHLPYTGLGVCDVGRTPCHQTIVLWPFLCGHPYARLSGEPDD